MPKYTIKSFVKIVSVLWLLYVTSKLLLVLQEGEPGKSHLDSFRPCRVNVVDPGTQLLRDTNISRTEPCLITKTEPPFHICTYPAKRDKFISAALQSDGVWEPYITPILQKALNKYPESQLIDVGANIGYYSLLASKMGHLVIAIEPKEESIRRLQKAVGLNHAWNKIFLVQNALYDFHTNVTLTDSTDNQGGVWIKSIISKSKSCTQNESLVEAITMDHLLTVINIKQAVLKLDIEGFECKAMKGGQRLLNGTFIPYIFMEWGKMFSSRFRRTSPCPAAAMDHLAADLTRRGYIPIEVRTGFQLNPERCSTKWKIGDMYWRHELANPLQDPF